MQPQQPSRAAQPEPRVEPAPVSAPEVDVARQQLDAALAEAERGATDSRLRTLLREHWQFRLEHDPLWATELGVHTYDDRLPRADAEALAAMRRRRGELLETAKGIEIAALGEDDQLTLSQLRLDLQSAIDREVCQLEKWTIIPRENSLTAWNRLPETHRVDTRESARTFLERVRQIPRAIDDERINLELGVERGLVANAESTRRTLEMLQKQLEQPLEAWPLLQPARDPLTDWPDDAREAFRREFTALVKDAVMPALYRYRDTLETKVLPRARTGKAVGLHALSLGKACYAALVREYTTLDLTAAEVHEIGLREAKRIDAEIATLGRKMFGIRDYRKLLGKLRTDPTLYFTTADEVEHAAGQALADARAKIPEFFGRLPQTDCVMRRIPDYEAPYTSIAYYRQPYPDGSKPGEYFINVYEPRTRPRYEARVLAYHESIPGHHLQIAIAQEREQLPAFRRYGGETVFVEGWALYTERLAIEMGLYPTDLDRLGMLSFDAWRAGRLVVDTGIHELGWTREQAKQFLTEHTALAPNNIDNEVDRYIVWPGQALAYKIGQMEIWKLRREAEAALGDAFEVEAFHDLVLGAGPISLPNLRARVEAWVAKR